MTNNKTTWNHRVMADELIGGEVYLEIHEVYYDENNVPYTYTEKPISIGSEDVSGLTWTINRMQACLKKPILWKGDKFPQECLVTYKCLLCGRDSFTAKQPHNCVGGFRKRNIKWAVNYSSKP